MVNFNWHYRYLLLQLFQHIF